MKISGKRVRLWARGQIMVVFAIAVPVLLLALSLCIDVGDLYLNQVRIQTAVDSAVLAGGNYLPDFQAQALATANSYALSNGIASSEIQSIYVSPDGKALSMNVVRNVPCYFCLAMGEGTAYAAATSGPTNGVKVAATAEVFPVNSASGVVPLGVDYRTDLSFGTEVVLKQGQVGAGNWSPLALGGTGADQYRSNVENGYPATVTVGNELSTETGNLVGPTQQAINYRLSLAQGIYPDGTFENHALNDPRIMVTPIVDFSNINGSSQVPLKGFAVMWIVSVNGQGNVTCYFIHEAIPNATAATTTAAFFGAEVPILVQ